MDTSGIGKEHWNPQLLYTFNENENLLLSLLTMLRSSRVALGVRPGLLSEPYIVKVFPEPV